MSFTGASPVRGELVVNAPLKNHCANFSNRRADRILYFVKDENKLKWQSDDMNQAVANALKIQQQFLASGKQFILVVAPDKLSVYQDCLLNDSDLANRKRVGITQLLIAAGVNTPDLLRPFSESSKYITDLYRPNDTHLSESGFVLMAEKLEKFIADRMERP
jgi:hypothetical protein